MGERKPLPKITITDKFTDGGGLFLEELLFLEPRRTVTVTGRVRTVSRPRILFKRLTYLLPVARVDLRWTRTQFWSRDVPPPTFSLLGPPKSMRYEWRLTGLEVTCKHDTQ